MRWHAVGVEIPELRSALVDAGELLADAAERAGLDATVPSCPEWTVRDLVFHVGAVHRWAATTVREARDRPPKDIGGDPLADAELRPTDGELVPWFREGHAALVSTLDSAPDDVECWAFLPAPSPKHFWTRRQTHETTVHRVDTELAANEEPVVDPAVASDGIDELLTGFVVRRRGKLRTERPRTLGVSATDTGAHWLLHVSSEPVVTERVDGAADATLRGPASDVYLALWNRLSLGALDAIGDAELLSSWRELVQVRWN